MMTAAVWTAETTSAGAPARFSCVSNAAIAGASTRDVAASSTRAFGWSRNAWMRVRATFACNRQEGAHDLHPLTRAPHTTHRTQQVAAHTSRATRTDLGKRTNSVGQRLERGADHVQQRQGGERLPSTHKHVDTHAHTRPRTCTCTVSDARAGERGGDGYARCWQ